MAASAERGVAVESHPRLLDQRPAAVGSRYDDGPMVHGHFCSLPRMVGFAWPEACRGDRS